MVERRMIDSHSLSVDSRVQRIYFKSGTGKNSSVIDFNKIMMLLGK